MNDDTRTPPDLQPMDDALARLAAADRGACPPGLDAASLRAAMWAQGADRPGVLARIGAPPGALRAAAAVAVVGALTVGAVWLAQRPGGSTRGAAPVASADERLYDAVGDAVDEAWSVGLLASGDGLSDLRDQIDAFTTEPDVADDLDLSGWMEPSL